MHHYSSMYGYAHIAFMAVYLIAAVVALIGLRKKSLSETVRFLWVVLILAVPVLGAVAFWVINPDESDAVG